MTTKLQEQLFKKYPDLFKELRYISCGDGWYNLLDTLCADITEVSSAAKASQIKEKFATLRFYAYGLNGKASDLIMQAEEESGTICEICGKKGKIETSDTGWDRTRCKDHRGVIAE